MARRGKFGSILARVGGKSRTVDNSAKKTKVKIRSEILELIGADRAHVFDAFCGAGSMYDSVWKSAASYVGCDLTWYKDERSVYCADNRRVLRSVDISTYNIFDLDAYGNPWDCATIIADRYPMKKGRRIGMVLTDGMLNTLKMGGMPLSMALLGGFKRATPSHPRPGQGNKSQRDKIISQVLSGLAKRMAVKYEIIRMAENSRTSGVRYYGMILAGI